MKKQLQLFIIAMFTCFLLSGIELRAQSVTIMFAGDSSGVYCGAPFSATFIMYGQTTGYTASDSVSVYQNFGDGNDTLFYVLLVQPAFYSMYTHNYQLPGVYNCLYIVTGPDGNADTVFTANDVVDSASCGNINGQLYIDVNSNCIFDTGEPALQNMPVQLIYNSNVFATTYTINNGYYYFYVPNNNYTIQVGAQVANYGYAVTCPVSNQINVANVPSINNHFGLTCTSSFDLQAYVWSQRFRPGFNSIIQPFMHSASCQPVSGQAKLILDNPLISVVNTSVTPDAIVGDTLIWNFSNISWSANFGYVTVLTSLSAPLGDSICVTFIVEPADLNPANNTAIACRPISNSIDPNEKIANPGGNIMSGDWLTYTILFQNTGTDTAYHVFVLDTIEADLDMTTFQPLAASHSYDTYIQSSNVVKFDFPNIMLADSNVNEPLSHGWVTYRIKSMTGLSNGTSINNTAGIYFDFNTAVITNTTVNVIDDGLLVPQIPVSEFSTQVYPNPFTSDASLTIANNKAQIILMTISDITGKEIMQKQFHLPEGISRYRIRTDGLPAGMYFLNIHSEQINRTIKIVKE
jgi:uncharacterized repeat protein (TIGR01451 family)